MKWFNDLKVRQKLLLCMMIFSVMMVGIGGVGVLQIKYLAKQSQVTYEDNYVPTLILPSVNEKIYDIYTLYLHAVYNKDIEGAAKQQATIKELMVEVESLLEEYASYEVNGKSSEVIDTLGVQINNYNDNVLLALNWMLQGKFEEAENYINEVVNLGNEAQTTLSQLMEANKDQVAQIAAKSGQQAFQGIRFLVIIMLLGSTICFILGRLIALRICGQIAKISDYAEEIAEGKLNITIDIEGEDEMGALASSFRKMIENTNEVVLNIDSSAEQVMVGAKQVADTSIVLAQGATEQAAGIEELTSSIEEISAQIKQNAIHVNDVNEFAAGVQKSAVTGDQKMKEMRVAMGKINEAATQISKIMKVIDDIAFQTNILALNAAVEAARAGQHGKGFAVVAEEVRNLAARSAESAKETTIMLEQAIREIEEGSHITEEAADHFENIVHGVKRVADLTEEIAISCNEQSIGISQINQGTIQISSVVQSNSANSQEVAAASEELASQAEMMKTEVSKFETKAHTSMQQGYLSLDQIDPAILKLLEEMSNKKEEQLSKQPKDHPLMSDEEFGKY